MSGVSSRPVPGFDISAKGFTAHASDLGEVIALMSGGVRPDPETLSRLCLSMRVLQRFLLDEAVSQAGREAIGGAIGLGTMLDEIARVCRPVSLAPIPSGQEFPHAVA